jgi:hypothetical protein
VDSAYSYKNKHLILVILPKKKKSKQTSEKWDSRFQQKLMLKRKRLGRWGEGGVGGQGGEMTQTMYVHVNK